MSAPGLRSRTTAPATSPSDPNETISTPPPPSLSKAHSSNEDGPTRLSLLDVLRMLAGLILLSSILSYFVTGNTITWGYPRPTWTRPARIKAWWEGPLHLTDAQLALYNGTDPTLPILLALNSSIYDVSASPHLYGPGGSYAFFAGRDATRAFVTGCFDTDLNGDLRGVEEMYMPVEEDDGGDEAMLTRDERRERKVRRERDRRVAKRKVLETVEGWRGMFDGGKEGKYFWRGYVDRGVGSGWVGWGEVKELCEKARKGRERRTAGDVGKR